MKPKILILLGPTASGKSDLAVRLAKELNGEIISADSRQVYKGLDIGTGKITRDEMQGIPHHLLDVADPKDAKKRFTVADWKKMAEECIADITSRGKLPIICGGTGFYISALIDNVNFPDIHVDPNEQAELESGSVEELFAELKRLDPRRAAEIDYKNKRRVVRAIIIARELGAVPELNQSQEEIYDALTIGISIPDSELKERIRARLIKRIDDGMIEEAKRLHSEGLSYERMNELGLEYRYLAQFLKGDFGSRISAFQKCKRGSGIILQPRAQSGLIVVVVNLKGAYFRVSSSLFCIRFITSSFIFA